jgi:phosphoribosylformimino-5-aminoimidazole carboxamide ribotide isomerase
MLIPCIDLQDGRAVQLVHGRKLAIAVDDIPSLLVRFKSYPWLHLIDLDAARGNGDNKLLVRALCRRAKREFGMNVRVGGGIRNGNHAAELIRLGAAQIIIGSAAFRDGKINALFLRSLIRKVASKRIVIALDTLRGKIAIHGWRKRLSFQPQEVMPQLEPFCSAFLCTDVDREGTMSGANLQWFRRLRSATTHPIIAAGGIRSRREILSLEKIGMDAAVGMAVYKNRLR